MMVVGKKIEELIARLAQKAPAAGIHLIRHPARPSVDVDHRLPSQHPHPHTFQVSSKIDCTILDQQGAEALRHGRHALPGAGHRPAGAATYAFVAG